MPGSTSSKTTDSPKAKVTSETNGIFVRPVAVAGIFCPAGEGSANPPAIPEKRRFSTLLGELRPVSTGETQGVDDFARRRQSWDSRQKEIPFGQALLRKTPRNNTESSSRATKSDDHKNGTPDTDRSPHQAEIKNVVQPSQIKTLESGKKSDSTLKSDNLESASMTTTIDSSLKGNQAVKHNGDLTSKLNKASVFKSNDSNLKVIKRDTGEESLVEVKRDVKDSKLNKTTELGDIEKVCTEVVVEHKSISTENIKQTKKFYGLMKRESKQETPASKFDLIDTSELSSNSKGVTTKNKVYGVSKSNLKKELLAEVLENANEKVNRLSETSSLNKATTSKKDLEVEVVKNAIVKVSNVLETSNQPTVKSDNDLKKIHELKATKEPVKTGIADKFSESPPKDVRTVRRTSGIIAAKIQNMFSNFQPEKAPPTLPKKTKVPEKISSSTKVSVQPLEDKKEVKSHALSSLANLSVETKLTNPSDVKNSNSNENIIVALKPHNIKQAISSKENSNAFPVLSNLASDSKQNDSSNFIRAGEPSNFQGIKIPSKKDPKPDPSINVDASKQLNKKVDNIEGKMPIKKEDPSSSDGTKSFLLATNQETDRKSSSSTSTSNTVMEAVNKSAGVKKPISSSNNHSTVAEERNLKSTISLQNINNFTSSSTIVSQSFHTSHTVQVSSTSSQSSVASGSCSTISKKDCEISQVIANGNVKTSESSKVEIAKLTPSTQPGIVPTVNVLFRTKSPQSTSNKDENRKKVVIETTSSSAPSTILISPKSADTAPLSSATQSVSDTVRTVENIQVSLKSPQTPKKHTIVNLQKQEVAAVDLSLNKQSSSNTCVKTENGASCIIDQNKTPINEITSTTDKCLKTLSTEHKSTDYLSSTKDTCFADRTFSPSPTTMQVVNDNKLFSSYYTSSAVQDKVSVVDLNDWTKKFQSIDPEAPRAPLRRRAFRDSLPPSLPLRTTSRFGSGSLKRIDDCSPRYIPRSPSQSLVPQRYSYTEMLSKVCSMGVLPTVEPGLSKSCSSSSSQVSELWSELSEEQSTATHASEMLEAETTERMRLEKEVHELQNRYSQIQHRSDKMEMEIMESRVYRTELNGDLSEDEDADGSGSIYKQKYERAVRDMEMMKRRFQQQHEEEMEQKAILKKASDKRLAEALEDVDEERQVANQWKRKAQKCGAELQDIRLMLEEQMARNGELEKKQRRFDAELSAAQEEIKKEKLLREKLMREKDQIVHEKYALEQDLQASKIDSDLLHEKITQLNRELDELTLSSKGEEEVTQLKRAKQELERKSRDQEEELEELAAQVQMLEQAKLRLEMSLEKVRQEHRRETSVREEEIEEIRASFSKKIKNLEAQLESEQDERHQLVKQKHELERRLYEIADQPPPHDPEIERRLRRDLKRTKALLRDAQSMLEHTREGQSSKTLIRQLKNQLEDSEFAKATSIKARQAVETELQDCQLQLEEITRTKNEAETRCLQLSREKSAIQTQLEEAEEEMAEVMKKYKAVVAQMSTDQKILAEQNQQIAELETERQMLKEQLSEVSHKFEHLAGQSDDAHKVHWLDSKIRDLESKLELEQTTKARLEHQISRLKEQNDRAREECDSLRNKELQAQEAARRLQRQIRDSREDYSALQQKEADAYRKQHELEMALENTETDLQVTKNDLRLACQRIQDLQNALEDDLDSGTDVPDDSGSDSDSSFELSVLRNSSMTPIQRCESIASNLSYDTEGPRSRTASFTQELSAFSSRDDAEKELNGLPGLNTTSHLPDTERDEMV